MKKLIASAAVLLMAILSVPAASAADHPNPWKDSAAHVMELENFDSGFPTGDISTYPGFWSYNKDGLGGFASTTGYIKDGRLVLANAGDDAFFFNRRAGAISPTLLSQAEGVGFYIKNNTRSGFRIAFYGTGDKDKMEKGEGSLLFFNGASAQLVNMDGSVTKLSGSEGLVDLPKGAEGYLMFAFEDFIDGWKSGSPKLDASKTELKTVGIRINGATLNVRYTVELDHFFLYGKDIKHAPGTIKMSASTATTPSSAAAATTAKKTDAPVNTTTRPPVNAGETTLQTDDGTDPTDTGPQDGETTEAADTTQAEVSSETTGDATTGSSNKPNILIPILIIGIIAVVAVGAVVGINLFKKSKTP